jgi:electron transport complex protein RnfC
MKAPDTVYIPISQHIGAPAQIKVSPGDKVKKGQLIAAAAGFVSANIFSSVSGEVVGVVDRLNAQGVRGPHIQIKNDGVGTEMRFPVINKPTKELLLARIKDAGIVGLGGAAFPTHVKLSPPPDKPVDTLLINAAECEPYITCDHRVMLEYADEFIEGVKLLAVALGAASINIAVEENKRDAYDLLVERLSPDAAAAPKTGAASADDDVSRYGLLLEKLAPKDIKVTLLQKKYPQGAEKQLIYAALRRKVPAGGLPADIGVVVSNVHTALSAYKAVAEGKPLYERVMTVSGHGIKNPKNFWVPTGATYADVVLFCGGYDEENTAKIISGGPMMGFAQASLEPSVNKATSALLFLLSDETDLSPVTPCINCARCASVCPMRLMPMYIDSCTIAKDFAGAKKYGAVNCIECGCCVYICPANRQIVNNVRLAKKIIKQRSI